MTDAVFGAGSSESDGVGASKEVQVSVNAEQIAGAVEQVAESFRNGFSFGDILRAVRVAMEIAESIVGMPGPERKGFVVEVIRQAYRKVEPNIPWCPEPIETWIENYVLDNLVPAAIELLISATKGEVKVNEKD